MYIAVLLQKVIVIVCVGHRFYVDFFRISSRMFVFGKKLKRGIGLSYNVPVVDFLRFALYTYGKFKIMCLLSGL